MKKKNLITLFRTFILLCAFAGRLSLYAQITPDVPLPLKSLARYDTLSFNFESFFRQTTTTEGTHKVELDLRNYGSFSLLISPSNLLLKEGNLFAVSGGKKVPVSDYTDVYHWMGNVQGQDKMTRLNIYPDELSGYIETPEGLLSFESIRLGTKKCLLVYRPSDVSYQNIADLCHVENPLREYKKTSGNNQLLTYENASCPIVKVEAIASYGLFKKNKFDSIATFNEIRNIFNLADGVYAKYVGIRLKICSQFLALDTTKDYWKGVNLPSRNWGIYLERDSFKGKVAPDIYHYFNEHFNSTTTAVGVAYRGYTCEGYQHSSSMEDGTLTIRAGILCHELGHNLNADHALGTNCGTPSQSIMCPSINSNMGLVFNSLETNVINTYISDKLKAPHPAHCLSYPIDMSKSSLNLCAGDSDLLSVERLLDFHIEHYYEGKLVETSNKDLTIWVKNPGMHSFIFRSDTSSNLSCRVQRDVFAVARNFTVTQTGEKGIGSLNYAIRNSNGCKGKDTIRFQLPASRNVIRLTNVLPPVIDDCVIDGTSQKGFTYPATDQLFIPPVAIYNQIPSSVYSKHCFLFGRESYTLKGIEIRGFEMAVTNYSQYFSNSTFSDLLPLREGHPFMGMRVYATKFISNKQDFALDMTDSTLNNDQVEIGDGTLKQANFFLSENGDGVRIYASEKAAVKGNYFGAEPVVDTATASMSTALGLSFCPVVTISGNYFCNTRSQALTLRGTGGVVKNNVFGYNPFNQSIPGFKGSGILVFDTDPLHPLAIGGLKANEGNAFYRQKKNTKQDAPYVCYASRDVTFLGNRSIQPDTSSILLLPVNGVMPVKFLRLDSILHDCAGGNAWVYGKIKPTLVRDTFYLHFYSAPPSVKPGYEPIHNFIGSQTIVPGDTLITKFAFSLTGCKFNEGILVTATSQKLNLTSATSNVIYPGGIKPPSPVGLRDTVLCPGKSVVVSLNGQFTSFTLNGKPVSGNTLTLSTPGFYELGATDARGCVWRESRILRFTPDYLHTTQIQANDFYSYDSVYTVQLGGIFDDKKWQNFKWSAVNGFVYNDFKLKTIASFVSQNAEINYEIKDVNGCSYAIHKSLQHLLDAEPPSLTPSIVLYPNPSETGIFFVRLAQPENIRVYNSLGSPIQQVRAGSTEVVIDLSSFAGGVFFLNVEGFGYYRIVKK